MTGQSSGITGGAPLTVLDPAAHAAPSAGPSDPAAVPGGSTSDGAPLASTGATAAGIAALAMVLMLLGLVLVHQRRRRAQELLD
ncbi:LPXTG cell wall anchor domain-containing protein [Nesterenkonia flava]|uniref:LPXTG cell wall anchor domain-containing protein n=1 Tax=Nesterenkonia flava TaxID=469799 RepID=A0ABU1FTE2_9MICC|nr:LPXTG cell wall anchor domain-containing protein [Nesterenkonia flava]MDR5711878.1 LPXTG cell wall anchor domain-containing protein [Nesterenkonia flava]